MNRSAGLKAESRQTLQKTDLSLRSAGHLLQYFLVPIASGAVKIDEDLIESFPRDRLSVLSIHQSKGLEFPMVIVDVGSDFRNNHHAHAFKRFPSRAGLPHNMEDLVRSFSPLKLPRRSGADRAFDDLIPAIFCGFQPAGGCFAVGGPGCRFTPKWTCNKCFHGVRSLG